MQSVAAAGIGFPAIVETGFKGYVGQEFIPKKEPFTSLTEAVEICDV